MTASRLLAVGSIDTYAPPVPDLDASQWVNLRVELSGDEVDHVAGLLWSVGVAGIEERTNTGGSGRAVELVVGLTAGSISDVLDVLGGRWPVTTESVGTGEWSDEWRQWAKPWRAGSRLVVVPTWVAVPAWAGPGDVVVRLDPGRAFGSGAHPTTRLCLAELESRVESGGRMLDVGCGSGVLSVAAALLGAGAVEAIDIDREAVRATEDNAVRNGVHRVVRSSLTPVEELSESVPLVVANIGAATLVASAECLMALVEPGGTVVLSGVLAEQVRTVRAAYEGFGAVVSGGASDGEWRALVFVRSE